MLLRGGQHVVLDAAYEQRVRRLLGVEGNVVAPVRGPLGLDELLGGEVGGADGHDLARAHQVGQYGQCLVDVGGRVGAVYLVEVDVVGAQPPEAALDGPGEPAPGVAAPVRIAVSHPDREVALGRQHDLVASAVNGLADDLLGLAAGVLVGGVDEIDPAVQRRADQPDRFVVVAVPPGTQAQGAQGELAYGDAGAAENPVLHDCPLMSCPRGGIAELQPRRRHEGITCNIDVASSGFNGVLM